MLVSNLRIGIFVALEVRSSLSQDLYSYLKGDYCTEYLEQTSLHDGLLIGQAVMRARALRRVDAMWGE